MEHIGYPPELLHASKLNDLYSGLDVNEHDYLGNALNMTVFGTNYAFSKLREKVTERLRICIFETLHGKCQYWSVGFLFA